MSKLLIIPFILFLNSAVTYSQGVDSLHHIKALGRVKDDAILLRWATADPISWKLANKYGYTIERHTILRKKEILAKPEKVQLNLHPIKPQPEEAWLKSFDSDDYVAIAAQAIYGDSFEASPGNANNLIDVANKVKEIEQRFSFALFAADHSFKAALLSGLALKDSTVKPNEKYLYKIYVNASPQILKIDTALVYMGLDDHNELPEPKDLFAIYGDRVVNLRWPVAFLNDVYVSYTIERSDDGGKTFKSINNRPFLNTENGNTNLKFFSKTDSLPSNDKNYHYRVRGQTSFGETGPPSTAVQGSGIPRMLCEVGITKGMEMSNGKVRLDWDVKCEIKIDIQGFEINRATNTDGPYNQVNKQPITPGTKSFVDDVPLGTNYYRITLLGKNNQRINSHPYLVQLADSIPPGAPQQLLATIDTLGIVKLSWSKNKENDLLGYRVFRSNFESSEYSQVTISPVKESQLVDTVNIKTLTKKVYYKITAEDLRHNRSAFSAAVVLLRPDVIPPVPPVIKSIRSTPEGVEIYALPSSSEDVEQYKLYRKQKNAVTWDLIQTFTGDSILFKDTKLDPKTEYYYSLTAIDHAGLESERSQPATGKILNLGIRPAIKKIQSMVNREEKVIQLKWAHESDGISKYYIYRAIDDAPISLYKSISEKETSMSDTDLNINTTYHYRLKVLFNDGSESLFSDELIIKY